MPALADSKPEPARSTRRDCEEQIRLILLHRERLMRQTGGFVSAEAAAADWVGKYAASWRRVRETRRG